MTSRLPAGPFAGAAPFTGGRRPGGSRSSTDASTTVARLAGRILRVEGPIRAEDDFLDDLGASSLALFQLLTAMEEEFACRIEIGRIIEDTTIGGLSAWWDRTPTVPLPVGQRRRGQATHLHDPRLPGHRPPLPAAGLIPLARSSADRHPGPGVRQPDQADQEHGGPDGRGGHWPDPPAAAGRALRGRRPLGRRSGGLRSGAASGRRSGEDVSLVVLIDSPVPRSSLHYLWAEAVLNWPDIRVADAAERMRQAAGAMDSRRARFQTGARQSDRVSGGHPPVASGQQPGGAWTTSRVPTPVTWR